MAAKKRFNIPTLDELDENKTPRAKNKTKFQLFRRTGDSSKPVNEVTSEKNNSSEQVIGSIKTNSETGKRIEGGRQSHSLELDLKTQNLEEESNSSSSSKEHVSSKLASNFPSSSSTCGAVSSSETTVGDACVRSGQLENVVGKSFKDTFAFLKNTRHYEEAEAKMKEIESAKPTTTKIPAPSKSKPNAIQVNPRQKGNPVLKFIRCVPWEYSDITADYVMGGTTCALFLSLRYHHFNPNYIHERLRLLGKSYELRILLVLVDVKDPHQTLRELAKMAIMADLTLMLTWSSEEAGKYLETYKVYENKPVDALQGQNDGDYLSKLQDCLTTVKGINKTDVLTLNSTFGSLSGIAKAPKDDLVFLPGFGPLKAKRLHSIFHEPFLAKKKKSEEGTSPVTNN